MLQVHKSFIRVWYGMGGASKAGRALKPSYGPIRVRQRPECRPS